MISSTACTPSAGTLVRSLAVRTMRTCPFNGVIRNNSPAGRDRGRDSRKDAPDVVALGSKRSSASAGPKRKPFSSSRSCRAATKRWLKYSLCGKPMAEAAGRKMGGRTSLSRFVRRIPAEDRPMHDERDARSTAYRTVVRDLYAQRGIVPVPRGFRCPSLTRCSSARMQFRPASSSVLTRSPGLLRPRVRGLVGETVDHIVDADLVGLVGFAHRPQSETRPLPEL
jgi:hypothetical protein